jgi:chemotaxis protein methyltransferase WspC
VVPTHTRTDARSPDPRPRRTRARSTALERGPPGLSATLAAATSLADRGQLVEALAMCEVLVAEAPPVAAHNALLGVVQQSRGQSLAAERAFTQALYIDPQHRESLVHLSLLLRGRGQVAVADQLRVRAERARGKA